MKKVLLIYECIPDYLKIYELVVDNEEYHRLLNCHNKYYNSDVSNEDSEDLDWLNEWIMQEDKKDCVIFDNTEDSQEPIRCGLYDKEHYKSILGTPFTIIVTGFIL